MKRAIVTGGTGFIGANLARRLLADGHEVHLLVRSGYKSWRIDDLRADVRLHEVRLEDAAALTGLLRQIRPEWVFHLAAHGAYPVQIDLPQMLLTNIHGTINLVTACLSAGFEGFVNTGSSSEYGLKDHPPKETEFLEPNSDYAATKSAATLFCRHLAQREHAPLTTLRLYSVYGPYEEPARLIPTLIMRGLRGEWPPLVRPETARDYVFVDDVVEAYLLAIAHPSEPGAIYNVGTGVQTTLREVVEVAQRGLPIVGEPKWGSMPPRQWDTDSWVADSALIREELGWRHRRSFDAGFRETLEWFRQNGAFFGAGHP